MQLSTSLSILIDRSDPLCLQEKGYLRSMRQCAKAGFRLLDWNACDFARVTTPPGSTGLVCDDWRDFVDAMRCQADALSIRFNQAHGLIFDYFGQDDRADFLRRMEERVMLSCAALGIKQIVYHPIAPQSLQETEDAEGCRRANRDYISRAAERAGALGLQIAVENMFTTRYPDGTRYWRYCSFPEELVELVDSIGMENVKICLDVGHAHMMKEALDRTVAFYGSRLAALHIHDNDGASDQHLMPFHGTIEWERLMRALHDVRYAGDFTYELHYALSRMPAQLQSSMLRETVEVGQWLIDCYERAAVQAYSPT